MVVVLFSCTTTPTKESKDQEGKKEYPEEWMYSQRAYPDNIINTQAIAQGISHTRAIREARNNQGGNDWLLVGPLNTGGRVTDIALDPTDDHRFFVGTSVGGIFRTQDGGQSWDPVFDAIGRPSIGNIAIAPSNPQIIYVGTGEANGSATSGAFFGDGMYRSNDGGDTWENIGLPESHHIGRIVVDPSNPDRVFVAATGVLYGTSQERGVYRTVDGGNTWERILFLSESTAAIDLVINPDNPDILFAAMWERTREAWQRDYGGLTSTVHRTIDGGDTWEQLGAAQGLPAPDEQTGRIGLAISDSDPNTLYARYTTNEITNEFNGLYKTTNSGDSWTLVTLGDLLNVDSRFGWFFGNIRVNPTNSDEVYVLGQRLFKTTSSGITWEEVIGMHVDHHAMEFSKNNSDFILAGNDGGVYASNDNGATWSKFTNLPITQFYNIEVDQQNPERLYGGTQDNNTIRTIDAGTNSWESIWGGDGFHVNVDPVDNNFIYVEFQFGGLGRSIDGGETFESAREGIGEDDRRNWNSPVIISPFNSQKVYYGSNLLYISDHSEFWTPISPDLTRGQHPSGSLSYGTLTAIAPSYNNLETIYTGSDDGVVSVTFDGGTTWNNISDGLPNRYVTSIAISPSNDLVAYATFSGFTALDYTPHVFKTEDGGQTWTDISSNLPSIPVNDIIINSNERILFLATDMGVWYSITNGDIWELLGNNLPITIVRDLKLHEPTSTLFAGTFGRSMHRFDISEIESLGIEASELTDASWTLSPSPAVSNFTISHSFVSVGEITIYDSLGRKLKTLFKGNLQESQNKEFTTNNLSPGVYFVSITSNGSQSSKPIVVK